MYGSRPNLVSLLGLLSLVATVFLAAPARAADTSGVPRTSLPPDMSYMGSRWMDRLDLTPQQRDRVNAIHDRWQRANAGLFRQLAAARAALASDLRSGGPDIARARRQARHMGTLTEELITRYLNLYRQVSEVLTPAQREKLGSMVADAITSWRGPGSRLAGTRGAGAGGANLWNKANQSLEKQIESTPYAPSGGPPLWNF